ncbi:MAG TPA: ABC transporter permease [Xanthobacteraceae bacterium]|jgi:simple sugar transport system permease protein|nr:ABC transporter permease [Xanthobacteraceae bacterium]
MSIDLWRGALAGSILSGTSLFYAALGELIGEKSGVVNLGLEGVMLIGAAVGFAVASLAGDPYLGVLAAAIGGGILNLLFGYLVVGRRANQLATGLTMMFFATGASAFIGHPFVGGIVKTLPRLRLGGLFDFDLLVYLAVPTGVAVWALLFYTRWGLGVRAVGENPQAAFAAGRQPERLQYQALFLGGLLGGVGGAHLSIALTLTWAEGMTAGRGFIAMALVIFANWNPLWIIAGAVLFGGAEALQLQLQAQGIGVSPFLMSMVPYLLTLLVLLVLGWRRRLAAPAALGRGYLGTE